MIKQAQDTTMNSTTEMLEILDLPPYVRSWSVVSLPGYIAAVLGRYERNHGSLPTQFSLIACPQAEVNGLGGLPDRVRELTDSRTRIQHFTSCNKLYLVIILLGEEKASELKEIQSLLSWTEAYEATVSDQGTQLRFVNASEEIESIEYAAA